MRRLGAVEVKGEWGGFGERVLLVWGRGLRLRLLEKRERETYHLDSLLRDVRSWVEGSVCD
jgi:hypothetical protein